MRIAVAGLAMAPILAAAVVVVDDNIEGLDGRTWL